MTDSMLPNEALSSQLSAFVDDELPSAETDLFVRRLVRDTELKQSMGRYQLMGEALRAPNFRTHLSRDFSARIATALDLQESAVDTSLRSMPARSRQRIERWLKPVVGVAVAASVALVAVLAVRSQPDSINAQGLSADALQPVVLTAQRAGSGNSYVVPVGSNAPSAPIPAARLTNYVVAHSEFSSPLGRRNMMTGLLASDQPVAIEETVGADVNSGR
jgi:sigma-E factor negative regulatory protein RseA